MVLAIIGWFFLGLLALFILLMVVPVSIMVRYSAAGGLLIRVRVLFVFLTLWPMKARTKPKKEKKPRKKKEKKAKEDAEEEEAEEKPKKSFSQRVAFIKRLVRAGMAAMKRFFRHLRITGIRLVLPIHAEEAADTAKRCGQAQAAIGALRAVADGRLRLRFSQLQVLPDYAGQLGGTLSFSCKLWFCPGIIFVMGGAFLRQYLRKRPYSKAAYKRALAQKRAAAQARRANGGTVGPPGGSAAA